MGTRVRKLSRFVTCLSALTVVLLGSPVGAQDTHSTDLDPRLRYVPPETNVDVPPPVLRECKPRYMAGPGVGAVLGTGAVGLGGSLIWAGNFYGQPRTGAEKALIAGGSLMIGAGLAAVIYSSIKLTRNKRERERLCSPIDPSR